MAKSRKSKDGLDTKTLVAGVIGVTPIPLIGEIGLAYFCYKMLESTPYKLAGIPAALLTRLVMYQELYLPIYKAIGLTS